MPQTSEIVFQHLIDLPNCDCVFCSTMDVTTGRTKLFLIFNACGRIYIRNAHKDTWDEVQNSEEAAFIRNGYQKALDEHVVPSFSM